MTQAEMMLAKGYCTASEAAAALGVHLTTVYRALQRGVITGSQIGRARYVLVASLVTHVTSTDPDALSKLDGLRILASPPPEARLKRSK